MLVALGAAFSGCGAITSNTSVPTANTPCTSTTAHIGIGDGFIQNLCGCGGTSGQVVVPPQTFTCTLNSTGTTVFFDYIGTQLSHQIAPAGAAGGTGSPTAFVSSPINNPHDKVPIVAHAIKLDTSGTYSFTDLFTPQMQGSIIVP